MSPIHTNIHKEIHFKELAHATMKGSRVQNVIREASRLETQEILAVQVQEQSSRERWKLMKLMLLMKSKSSLLENSPSCRKDQPFVLVRPPAD